MHFICIYNSNGFQSVSRIDFSSNSNWISHSIFQKLGQNSILSGLKVHECLRKVFPPETFAQLESTLFVNGVEIFRGYSDDSRNTDNAWIETVVFNYHDDDGSLLADVALQVFLFKNNWQINMSRAYNKQSMLNIGLAKNSPILNLTVDDAFWTSRPSFLVSVLDEMQRE